MKLDKLYTLYNQCNGIVTTDSRSAKGLFFALKGESHDANLFAPSALDNGASYVVVDNPSIIENQNTDTRYILVDNTLDTLQKLACFHRQHALTEVFALTGTNGKTTTKELLTASLRTKYEVGCTKGNFNNHIGVPLTLLSFSTNTEIAIVEMGANHVGEISELCKIALPNKVLITNVGMAHLEGFGSFDGVKKTKGEMYNYAESAGATAFVSSGDETLLKMAGERNMTTIFYDNQLTNVTTNSGFVEFDLADTTFKTYLSGAYNAKNIMAAVAVADIYGVDKRAAAQACADYMPQNNRSQVVETQRNIVLMDAYNANPSSMNEALDNFKTSSHAKKIAVLGQMNELGAYSNEEHMKIVEKTVGLGLEMVLFVGDNYDGLVGKYYKTTEELIDFLKLNVISDAYILVKGSRSNRLESIQEYL